MLKVRTYPDPVLRQRTASVKRVDRELLRLVEEMFETMYERKGLGLAAPQVGESIRLCVLNCTGREDGERVLVNPVLVETHGEAVAEEGCLSVPGVSSKVPRAERVKVRAYDLEGRELEIEADGLEARCLQHELDHLEGRLFFEALNDAARMTLNAKLKTLEERHRKQS